jgi:hypothetical protein
LSHKGAHIECSLVKQKLGAVELRLSGLTGTAKQPDTQNIRITGFFFENRLHGQFGVEKIYKRLFCLPVYLHTNKKLIRNSLYVFDKWEKIEAIKR